MNSSPTHGLALAEFCSISFCSVRAILFKEVTMGDIRSVSTSNKNLARTTEPQSDVPQAEPPHTPRTRLFEIKPEHVVYVSRQPSYEPPQWKLVADFDIDPGSKNDVDFVQATKDAFYRTIESGSRMTASFVHEGTVYVFHEMFISMHHMDFPTAGYGLLSMECDFSHYESYDVDQFKASNKLEHQDDSDVIDSTAVEVVKQPLLEKFD